MGVNPYAILLRDAVWNWMKAKVVKDIMRLATFFGNTTNRGLMHIPKGGDTLVDMETPMLLLVPAGLLEWMLTTPCTPWELHKKIIATIAGMGETSTPIEMKICLD